MNFECGSEEVGDATDAFSVSKMMATGHTILTSAFLPGEDVCTIAEK